MHNGPARVPPITGDGPLPPGRGEPGGSEQQWGRAWGVVGRVLAESGALGERWRSLAIGARDALQETLGLLQEMSRELCPGCRSVCCINAQLDYAWRDLVFIQALGLQPPPHGLRTRPGQPCRYHGDRGCRLERPQRPFLCNWWLCRSMNQRLGREPYDRRRSFREAMAEANRDLDALGAGFIHKAVAMGLLHRDTPKWSGPLNWR